MVVIYLDSPKELKEVKKLIKYFVVQKDDTKCKIWGVGEREVFVLEGISTTKLEQIKAQVGLRIFVEGKLEFV